jgi:RNA recognition motif-containing protein
MGNIESWMTHSYLTSYLNSIQIYPKSITLKNPQNKRGCAFLEFSSKEIAQKILVEYNNKEINGIKLKFNWVHSLEEKNNKNKITKFTVSKNNIFIFRNSFLLEI